MGRWCSEVALETDGNHHILIVDDDELVRYTLKEYLTEEGFRVSPADSAKTAREILGREKIDIILLDIRMPGEDGLSFTRDIRSHSNVPIILITGRGMDVDKIIGLELGADDYLTKPFNERELLARVHNILRRAETPSDPQTSDIKSFLGWTLDIGKRRLTSPKGEDVRLTRGEFHLLAAFVESRNRVLTRDYLLDAVSGREWAPNDRTIDVMVRQLRKKMEDDPDNPEIIVTVHGVGYSFAPDVA